MVHTMIRWTLFLLVLIPLAQAQPVGNVPYSALSSCPDSNGNHLNANNTTGAITCGTSTAPSGSAAFALANVARQYGGL